MSQIQKAMEIGAQNIQLREEKEKTITGLPRKGPGGRPTLYKSTEELQAKVDEYWKIAEIEERPLTFAGFAQHLGMSTETMARYATYEMFCAPLQNALRIIKASLEERMLTHKGNPAGLIFLAKNYGYKDTQEVKHTHQSIGSVLSQSVSDTRVFDGEIMEDTPILSDDESLFG